MSDTALDLAEVIRHLSVYEPGFRLSPTIYAVAWPASNGSNYDTFVSGQRGAGGKDAALRFAAEYDGARLLVRIRGWWQVCEEAAAQ